MNIALIGFRGAGKTAVARVIAKTLGKKLISTDEEIENMTKFSIDKFVKKHGWDKFRETEAEVIEKISDFDDCVFDTGCGIVMRNENIINLKKNSIIVLLTADIKTIKDRLKSSKRPALTSRSHLAEIEAIFKERESRYLNAADYAIDTSRIPPEEVADLVIHYMRYEIQ